MNFRVRTTARFRKDYRRMQKRGMNMELLDEVILKLAAGEKLSPQYRNHSLVGAEFAGMQECHIRPDWLLVYHYEKEILVLVLSRTGSHSDLF